MDDFRWWIVATILVNIVIIGIVAGVAIYAINKFS